MVLITPVPTAGVFHATTLQKYICYRGNDNIVLILTNMQMKLSYNMTPTPGYYLDGQRCFEIPESRFGERGALIEPHADYPASVGEIYEHKDGFMISLRSISGNAWLMCPMIRCQRCKTVNEFYVEKSGPHLKAVCNNCDTYIKFVSKDLQQLGQNKTTIINEQKKPDGDTCQTMVELFLIGHLGKDALVNNVNGKSVINFSVAHTEKWNDAQGVAQTKTLWVDCAYWTDKTAVAPYLLKGTQVFVKGTPEVKTFTKGDGTQGSSMACRVFSVVLLGSPQGAQNATAQPAGPVANQPFAQPAAPPPQPVWNPQTGQWVSPQVAQAAPPPPPPPAPVQPAAPVAQPTTQMGPDGKMYNWNGQQWVRLNDDLPF